MKVLISRPDKIGDVILALHAVKQLKKLRPDFEVYLHISTYTEGLVKNVSFLDGYVTLDEDLRKYNFDAVVDLMAKNRTARRYVSPHIKTRIGNSARWFSFLYTATRFIRRSHGLINEAEYNWQLIGLLDPELKNIALKESVQIDDFVEILPWSGHQGASLVMPGVTVSAIGWKQDNWIELGKLLAQHNHTYIILGPAEADLIESYKQKVEKLEQLEVVSPQSFEELLGLLKSAKHFIGPSTGITHLAATTECDGVALYPEQKSMHPRRWQPFNSSFKIVSLDRRPTPQQIIKVLHNDTATYEALNPLARSKVSAFVVCCNEERNIRRCLESISWCDEIIVVDSGSTDKTREICKEYTNNIIVRPWEGHRQQKQFALNQCSHNWVLNIDSDEEVSTELRGQLLRVLAEDKESPSKYQGFNLCRTVYFLNRWWTKGGWYPEYRLRFFQKNCTTWGGVNPHEKALVHGKIGKLSGDIFHFTYSGFHHQIDSLNAHSSNAAKYLYENGKRCHPLNIVFNPLFRFLKFYFLKQGFREGFAGFVVGVTEALYTFLKYAKLWELARQDQLIKDSTEQCSAKSHSDDEQMVA